MQDEVNQDYSEQNEVDGMKKGADWIEVVGSRPKIRVEIDASVSDILEIFHRGATPALDLVQ